MESEQKVQNAVLEMLGLRSDSEMLLQFGREFLRSLSAHDLERLAAEDLVGAIIATFADVRSNAEVKLELSNPDYEALGWQSPWTVCVLHHPDLPFLVDSIRICLADLGVDVQTQVNLVLSTERDATDRLIALGPKGLDHPRRESVVWLEIDRIDDEARAHQVKQALHVVLHALRTVVSDFQHLRDLTHSLAESLDQQAENPAAFSAFLRWLLNDHFTFLGYEFLACDERGDWTPRTELHAGLSRLHPLTPDTAHLRLVDGQAPALDERLVVVKGPVRSTIHRAAYPDVVSVVATDASGQVVGEHRLIGLFTARVYDSAAFEIPLIADKLRQVIADSQFAADTHNQKALRQILQVYPRDALFQTDTQTLTATAVEIVKLHERKQLRLFMHRDRFGFFCTALLYIPRDLYSTATREMIQELLCGALQAEDASFSTYFSESIFARVQFVVRLPRRAPEVNARQLERLISDRLLSWDDQLQEALTAQVGLARTQQMIGEFGHGFSMAYREAFTPRRAVFDLLHAASVRERDEIEVILYQLDPSRPTAFRLKLFSKDAPIPLSNALPLIEHLGAWVLSETPYVLNGRTAAIWVHDYQIELSGSGPLESVAKPFQEAFMASWNGLSESDGLSRLVVLSALNWRDVALLRALCRYVKQLGFELSSGWMTETLVAHPRIARDLVALFHARFDPRRRYNPDLELRVAQGIEKSLESVTGLREDRLLRRLMEVITATVRTNFFQMEQGQYRPCFSFKIKTGGITDVPKPIPLFEIFVYSPRVEGVHLRSGLVARGGIRWSDRAEDYRTEVLGLVKAQQVKNAVIVPVGAKGVFYPKRLPVGDREAINAEAVACYQAFIGALLDVTDNRVGESVVSPPEMHIHDGPDPYLVVAADKGTATFSDLANDIAKARGFWLGDAFASGGSAGYDHKKMGITARGAWISVQRHFRELGVDCQREAIRCIGIGDMSGDVFGNGLLLSPSLALVGAFNHQHIFLDPNPDVAAAFGERARLFAMPRSSWADYDPNLISPGGGVFSRFSKSTTIAPTVAEVLGCLPGDYPPDEVLRLMLKAPVDLLWNGGIGTYVKGSEQTHLDVGDKANDAIRINGRDLAVRVIGEGGNLGLTQAGRVEAALHGVRLNTDFIDNSGGVDCSDHEVNIKIFFNGLVESGELSLMQRDRILRDMTDEVAERVLSHNREQAQAVTLAMLHSQDAPDDVSRLIQDLSARGLLDRELEGLPSDDVMAERRRQGQSYTRPELAVLISTVKNQLKKAFANGSVMEEPVLARRGLDGFPKQMVEAYGEALLQHPLITEIAATQWANRIVNRMGMSFVARMEAASGRSTVDVLRAYAVVEAVYGFDEAWETLEQMSGSDILGQLNEMRELHRWQRRACRWLLRSRALDDALTSEIERYREGVQTLLKSGVLSLFGNAAQPAVETRDRLLARGIPASIAEMLAVSMALHPVIGLVEVALATGSSLTVTAQHDLALRDLLGCDRLLALIHQLPVDDQWQSLARESYRDDCLAIMQGLLARLGVQSEAREVSIDLLFGENHGPYLHWMDVLARLEQDGSAGYPMIAVAMRELRLVVEQQARPVHTQ